MVDACTSAPLLELYNDECQLFRHSAAKIAALASWPERLNLSNVFLPPDHEEESKAVARLKALMIFKDGIRPEWEAEPGSASGAAALELRV